MKDALAIHRWLLAHQVHHEIVRLPRPLARAEELPQALSAAPGRCLMVTVFEVATRVGGEAVVAVASPVSAGPRPGAVAGLLDDRLSAGAGPIFTATGERRTALRIRALDLLTLLPGKTVDLRLARPGGSRAAVARRH
ncbi:hypothetical protein ACGFI3_45460 [Nonomuraea wenchangensis]|uniref:hypothetical protein n=1 Tax=Nonomuraea wenchangensis TaxID=568860 RepID=UPI00372038D5